MQKLKLQNQFEGKVLLEQFEFYGETITLQMKRENQNPQIFLSEKYIDGYTSILMSRTCSLNRCLCKCTSHSDGLLPWPGAAKPKLEVGYPYHLPPSILYSGGTRRARGLRTTPGDTIRRVDTSMVIIMMIFVLCPKAGSLAFTPSGDEISEVVSRCLPHRQLWVSNLSKVATQWREVDPNPRPFGCKAQNLPLHHGVPQTPNIKKTLKKRFCEKNVKKRLIGL